MKRKYIYIAAIIFLAGINIIYRFNIFEPQPAENRSGKVQINDISAADFCLPVSNTESVDSQNRRDIFFIKKTRIMPPKPKKVEPQKPAYQPKQKQEPQQTAVSLDTIELHGVVYKTGKGHVLVQLNGKTHILAAGEILDDRYEILSIDNRTVQIKDHQTDILITKALNTDQEPDLQIETNNKEKTNNETATD